MIPGGDHSTRSIVHRRVSSWASWSEAGTAVGAATTFREDDNESSNADQSITVSQDLSRRLLPELEYEEHEDEDDDLLSFASRSIRNGDWKLWIVFFMMISSGVSNVVLAKLQAFPMYNYPTFLNLYGNIMYVLLSFCYLIPASYFGWFQNSIPTGHLTKISKKPFMVMGLLDAVAGSMQVLATIYLPGTLLVLLPQIAIPLSILFSRLVLRESFTQYQYLGAAIVFSGILVVLFPVLTHKGAPDFSCQAINQDRDCILCQNETNQRDCESHGRSSDPELDFLIPGNDEQDLYCLWISKKDSLRHDDFLTFVWSIVMLISCVPMVFSTIYKQVALQVRLDPILINGWVSLFQLLFGIFLVVPAGYVSSPEVKPLELPGNWRQATECLFAQNNSIELGCHPDECSQAALWVHLNLLSSVVYTISTILVLKYGSASMLYLGLTLMVPVGHLIFSLNDSQSTNMSDITGLIVLVAGLLLFRFGNDCNPDDPEEQLNNYIRLDNREDISGDDLDQAPNGNVFSSTSIGVDDVRTSDDKDGFLEFLREPFLLVGDI